MDNKEELHTCSELLSYAERLRKDYSVAPSIEKTENKWFFISGEDDWYCDEIIFCPYCGKKL